MATTVQDPHRPIRSANPCASWCTTTHDPADPPGSRECVSAPLVTAQSLEPTLCISTVDNGAWVPNDVHLALEQGDQEPAPRVSMSWGDGTVRTFTLDELAQHAAHAADLLAMATNSRALAAKAVA